MRKALILAALLPGPAALSDDIVIAALGDSLTQGYGLPQESGFVPQLQSWLDAEGANARLINAGVSGDTTAGGLSRVGWTLTPDVDALIVALGGNDVLRGLDPALSRSNLEGILKTATEAEVDVLLIGMQAPGNFGPDYKAEFDAMYPELAAAYGALHAESFFMGLNVAEDDLRAAQAFMQPDGIHPNAEGVTRIVEGLGPYVLELIARASES